MDEKAYMSRRPQCSSPSLVQIAAHIQQWNMPIKAVHPVLRSILDLLYQDTGVTRRRERGYLSVNTLSKSLCGLLRFVGEQHLDGRGQCLDTEFLVIDGCRSGTSFMDHIPCEY